MAKPAPLEEADSTPPKAKRLKKVKDAVAKQKPVPAGAQGGVAGNAPKDKLTSGIKAIFAGKSGPSGNSPFG